LKNLAIDGKNCTMERKNINRALKAARLASSPQACAPQGKTPFHLMF